MSDTEKEEILNSRKKVTEEDIIGLVKTELPYNCVEIKKNKMKIIKETIRFLVRETGETTLL